MHQSDFAAPNHVVKDGFVSMGAAEKVRQDALMAEFKLRHRAEYDRAVQAVVAQRRANAEHEAAQKEIVKLCPQGKVSDLLVGIKAEAAEELRRQELLPKQAPAPLPPVLELSPTMPAPSAKAAPELGPMKIAGQPVEAPEVVRGKRGKAAAQ
jgi:hypothetical protein